MLFSLLRPVAASALPEHSNVCHTNWGLSQFQDGDNPIALSIQDNQLNGHPEPITSSVRFPICLLPAFILVTHAAVDPPALQQILDKVADSPMADQFEPELLLRTASKGYWQLPLAIHRNANKDQRSLLQKLATHQDILLVQPDLTLNKRLLSSPQHTEARPPASLPSTLAKGIISAPIAHLPFIWQQSKGEGVTISIIDSGFDLELPEFRGLDAVYFGLPNNSPTIAKRFHGTAMASVIAAQHQQTNRVTSEMPKENTYWGVAPKATLVAIELVSSATSDILRALANAQFAGSDVINLSWELLFTPAPLRWALADLAQQGRNGQGTVIIAAAGNRPRQIPPTYRLAAQPDLLAINAVNHQGQQLSKVSGDYIDLAAPSFFDTFTRANLITSRRVPGSAKGTNSKRVAGSSAAAALVSGLAALAISSCPDYSADQIKQLLRTSSNMPDTTPDQEKALGAGIIDGTWLWQQLKQCHIADSRTKDKHQSGITNHATNG